MPAILRSPIWPDPRVKPPYGAAGVDWGHPLSRGLRFALLLNEGGGRPFDLLQQWAFALNNGPTWVLSLAGRAVSFTGSAYLSVDGAVQSQTFSLIAGVIPNGTSGYRGLWGTSGAPAPQELRIDDSTNTMSLMKQNTAGILTSTNGIPAGPLSLVGVTYEAATGDCRMFLNGRPNGSGTNAQSFQSVGTMEVGHSADGELNGVLPFLYYYGVALSVADAEWVTSEPYAFLRPIIRRRWFVPSAAALALARKEVVPIEWLGSLRRKELIPLEWTFSLRRKELIFDEWLGRSLRKEPTPIDWRGFFTLMRKEQVPIDWRGFLSLLRKDKVPIEWTLRTIPPPPIIKIAAFSVELHTTEALQVVLNTIEKFIVATDP